MLSSGLHVIPQILLEIVIVIYLSAWCMEAAETGLPAFPIKWGYKKLFP